ncbi:MAG: GNAT family N-acetyltransferase [Flavobacteriaceae bacterium]|nr:GNAT family N-acetyltransferase [Flavobacteriaceae bacterium]|tara:strand:- start:688 stop:1209 length:522 start_codon:yes stop_codon:yes gene_type:complete
MNDLKNEMVSLRALESADIEILFELENDSSLWKHSNRIEPYSKELLQDYIANSHRGVLEMKQIKFTVVNLKEDTVGFIDLFDFEPLHHRAEVGIVIHKKQQGSGLGSAALALLEKYAQKYLQLHQLYAHIAIENQISRVLFEKLGYKCVGTKADWNYFDGRYHDELLYQKIIE